MTTCGYFNKSKNQPCKNKAVAITLQPEKKSAQGAWTSYACNAHALNFANMTVRKGLPYIGAGTGYAICCLRDYDHFLPRYGKNGLLKEHAICVCGFSTIVRDHWHGHIVGANHSTHIAAFLPCHN